MTILRDGQVYEISETEFTMDYSYPEGMNLTIRGHVDSMPFPFNHIETRTTSTKPCAVPKKVIFNGPATIVMWADGTKTVVKCQLGDHYDRMTGFLLAAYKKACGNKGRYNDVIKRFVTEVEVTGDA